MTALFGPDKAYKFFCDSTVRRVELTSQANPFAQVIAKQRGGASTNPVPTKKNGPEKE